MPASAYRLLGSLLIPPRCAACSAPCHADDSLCARCESELSAARRGCSPLAGVGQVFWASAYEGAARELVAALKFAGRLALAGRAAEAIAASLPADLPASSVVAVPPAPLRLRRRGFDPAHAIAAALADRLELPQMSLLRRAGGPRQVGRPRAERLASPPRVRAVRSAPVRVLLVDDVLTTGATLRACAEALRGAGCVELRAAVFARACEAPAESRRC